MTTDLFFHQRHTLASRWEIMDILVAEFVGFIGYSSALVQDPLLWVLIALSVSAGGTRTSAWAPAVLTALFMMIWLAIFIPFWAANWTSQWLDRADFAPLYLYPGIRLRQLRHC